MASFAITLVRAFQGDPCLVLKRFLGFPTIVAASGIMEIFVVRRKGSWESYKNARALGKAKRRFQLFAPLVTPCAAKNAAKKRLATKGVLSVNT